jgi:protein involved in polysaccharide export with SLBB domain
MNKPLAAMGAMCPGRPSDSRGLDIVAIHSPILSRSALASGQIWRRRSGKAFQLGLFVALAGCANSSFSHGVHIVTANAPPQLVPVGSALLPSGNLDYRIAALDTLQIAVQPLQRGHALIDYGAQVRIDIAFAGGAYVIAPGDELSIDVDGQGEAPGQVLVRPDGRITLVRLSKDINAAGMTTSQLTAAVGRAYSATMVQPLVTIAVVRSAIDTLDKIGGAYQVGPDGKIVLPALGSFAAIGMTTDALAAQIEDAARRRFRNLVTVSASLGQLTGRDIDPRIDPSGRTFFNGLAKVSPDGGVFIQPGGLVMLAGLSLPQARAAIAAAVQPLYANPVDVDVTVAESTGLTVFVGGEVRQPGRFPYSRSMTLLKLITMSGWATDVGDLKRVLLLHPTAPGHYTVYRSNVKEVLDKGLGEQDLAVGPQDLVVVPLTKIGAADKFVDQYLRRMIPINASASYSYITNPVANVTNPASTATSTSATVK